MAQHFFTIYNYDVNIYGTSLDDRSGNDVNNFMDIECALHKKCYQIPMVVAQMLISSMERRYVGVCWV